MNEETTLDPEILPLVVGIDLGGTQMRFVALTSSATILIAGTP